MHNLFKLLKVLLLSFIIMTGTDGSNTPRQKGRLTENNNAIAQNQGTETEQFDKIAQAAQEEVLLTAAMETNPLQQQDDTARQQQQDDAACQQQQDEALLQQHNDAVCHQQQLATQQATRAAAAMMMIG